MKTTQHGAMHFGGLVGVPAWGFRGHNITARTLSPGRCVLWHLVEGNTVVDITMSTNIGVPKARTLALGVVYNTITPNNTADDDGYVVAMGYLNKLYVTGTVAISDWLVLNGTPIGSARTATASEVGRGYCFAIADQTHSGAASDIRAFVLPMRY